MPGPIRRFNCIICSKRTNAKDRRLISNTTRTLLKVKLKLEPNQEDVICNKCRHTLRPSRSDAHDSTCNSYSRQDPDYLPSESLVQQCLKSPPSITLNIKSTPKSHARCFICKRPGPKLVVVPSNARVYAFIDHNVVISPGTRCCPRHLHDSKLLSADMVSVPASNTTFTNRSTILQLLYCMQDICRTANERLDFTALHENEYPDLIGLAMNDFKDICQQMERHLRNTPSRSVYTTVGIFFLKLRSGMSNKLLSTIFGISRSSIRRAISSVRRTLVLHFVPKHLGLAHISREEIIRNHTRPLAQSLFGQDGGGDEPKLILVLDGTYIYIQKSNNFRFQRRSYSMHKGRPLLKPMVVVSTTGYFVTIVGPFFADAKNSDAKILNHMLQTNIENIKSFVREQDVFIVDRGFRDSIEVLNDLGIQAEMPAFMKKGQAQMNTDDANMSRLVTKIRWIVESANARIKRWRYLDRTLPNSQVPFIGDYVRIVCAVANKYYKPLASNNPDDKYIAQHMLQMSKQVNELRSFVDENHLERRSTSWKTIEEAALEHFPRLMEEQVRSLICGIYQMKLSPSYIQEYISGNSDIHVHVDEQNLIRVRIQSRHISAKSYLLWLRFNHEEVTSWYCRCRAGSRVVGVCSHIAAVVWYLGYARYRFMPNQIGVRNWGEEVLDASYVPQPQAVDFSDSSDEDDS